MRHDRPRLVSGEPKTIACGGKNDLATQTDFSEPMMRMNTDSAARYVGERDEAKAWDEAAEGYRD